jgi:hypothetical protein
MHTFCFKCGKEGHSGLNCRSNSGNNNKFNNYEAQSASQYDYKTEREEEDQPISLIAEYDPNGDRAWEWSTIVEQHVRVPIGEEPMDYEDVYRQYLAWRGVPEALNESIIIEVQEDGQLEVSLDPDPFVSPFGETYDPTGLNMTPLFSQTTMEIEDPEYEVLMVESPRAQFSSNAHLSPRAQFSTANTVYG